MAAFCVKTHKDSLKWTVGIVREKKAPNQVHGKDPTNKLYWMTDNLSILISNENQISGKDKFN